MAAAWPRELEGRVSNAQRLYADPPFGFVLTTRRRLAALLLCCQPIRTCVETRLTIAIMAAQNMEARQDTYAGRRALGHPLRISNQKLAGDHAQTMPDLL